MKEKEALNGLKEEKGEKVRIRKLSLDEMDTLNLELSKANALVSVLNDAFAGGIETEGTHVCEIMALASLSLEKIHEIINDEKAELSEKN